MVYPEGFLSQTATPSVQSSLFKVSSHSKSSLIFVTPSATAAAASFSVTLTGVSFGAPTVSSSKGIYVSTSMDRSSDGSPSGSLGGQVLNVSDVLVDADGSNFFYEQTLVCAFTTTSHLSTGDQVFIRICSCQTLFVTWWHFMLFSQFIFERTAPLQKCTKNLL